MTKMTTTVARQTFSDGVNRAAYGKERLLLTRRGKGLVAVVPAEDLAVLEELEDLRDARDARKFLDDMRRKREKTIPWAEVKRELDL